VDGSRSSDESDRESDVSEYDKASESELSPGSLEPLSDPKALPIPARELTPDPERIFPIDEPIEESPPKIPAVEVCGAGVGVLLFEIA